MSLAYLALTLVFAGVLLLFLLRPGAARPMVVWGVAALLPLLAALTGALSAQARAAHTLGGYVPAPVTVTINNGIVSPTLTLSAQDAACLERVMRLHSQVVLLTPEGPLRLDERTRVAGALPERAVVEALTLRGELHCPNFKAVTKK